MTPEWYETTTPSVFDVLAGPSFSSPRTPSRRPPDYGVPDESGADPGTVVLRGDVKGLREVYTPGQEGSSYFLKGLEYDEGSKRFVEADKDDGPHGNPIPGEVAAKLFGPRGEFLGKSGISGMDEINRLLGEADQRRDERVARGPAPGAAVSDEPPVPDLEQVRSEVESRDTEVAASLGGGPPDDGEKEPPRQDVPGLVADTPGKQSDPAPRQAGAGTDPLIDSITQNAKNETLQTVREELKGAEDLSTEIDVMEEQIADLDQRVTDLESSST